ncbi:penicillin-binding transpeptidase domain-containing protein [Desulfuromonas sp. CSMB_57]|uniref:penicillin-binding transpeptidase domain-containing protein n=1 Tax=Desulfuromonas sp. CSMB_57 TaxID=2807629 RepID=UPI001CD28296|nr:penicillin-binding transpeptidase domain-containing protein [Desulfuromonas sp. CSMB_57]
MKQSLSIIFLCVMLVPALLASCRTAQFSESLHEEIFGGLDGALVVIDCSSGHTKTYRPEVADTPLPPCSTFKIVNALIGLETGIIGAPDERFYQWDSVERSIPAWNRDLSLRDAFQVSCVPAFQNLARQIGAEQMRNWIARIGYGNQDISAGIDVFWLPSKGRRTILISPTEQARMVQRIIKGDVAFSRQSLAVLKNLMFIKATDNGRLYGKTGSGTDEYGTFVLGWFVGYVESKGKTYAFACAASGDHVMGKDAGAIVERFFRQAGLL